MNRAYDTSDLEPVTEEIHRWPPVTPARPPGMHRPAAPSPPRRRLFPRGWRDAMYAAWTLVAVLFLAILTVAGFEVLAMLGRSG